MKRWNCCALMICGASVCTAQTSAVSQPQRLAEWAANRYGVPFEFVAAIIDVESGWQPYAVSDKGAVGLMQLMPETAYRFGVRNRFRIEETFREV